MQNSQPTFRAVCACGEVEFQATGKAIQTVACYCDDCRTAGQQIDALPQGRSGLGADGGTVSVLFRKDRVRCVRGSERLTDHKLRPESATVRVVTSCCHSNVASRFDTWPMMPLRSFDASAPPLTPDLCIMTKFALDPAAIQHAAPRYATVSPGFVLKILSGSVQLGLQRIGFGGGRLY